MNETTATEDKGNDRRSYDSAARGELNQRLATGVDELQSAIWKIQTAIGGGEELTSDHIEEYRRAVDGLQSVVESSIVGEMDGMEPYSGAVERVTFGQMAEALGVSMAELNELREKTNGDD